MDFISQSHKAINAIMKKKKAATLREIVGVALFAGKDYSKTGTQWWLMAVSRAFAVATLLLFFGKEMVEGAVAALVLMTLSIFGDLVITLIAFWHQQNKRLTEPQILPDIRYIHHDLPAIICGRMQCHAVLGYVRI